MICHQQRRTNPAWQHCLYCTSLYGSDCPTCSHRPYLSPLRQFCFRCTCQDCSRKQMSTEALVWRPEWRDIYGRVGRAGEPAGVGAAPGGPEQADERGAHPAVAVSWVVADGRRFGHKHSHSAFAGCPLIYTPCMTDSCSHVYNIPLHRFSHLLPDIPAAVTGLRVTFSLLFFLVVILKVSMNLVLLNVYIGYICSKNMNLNSLPLFIHRSYFDSALRRTSLRDF